METVPCPVCGNSVASEGPYGVCLVDGARVEMPGRAPIIIAPTASSVESITPGNVIHYAGETAPSVIVSPDPEGLRDEPKQGDVATDITPKRRKGK